MKNPQDSKKNIRIIPYYDKNDHKKVKPKYSTIRVFGELKTYVKEYNKEKRKYTPSNTPVIVRGHWRHLQSPIFKNKQGETIWIPPYIKGANSEALHSRLIKIKE
jgi:hypothetical protein